MIAELGESDSLTVTEERDSIGKDEGPHENDPRRACEGRDGAHLTERKEGDDRKCRRVVLRRVEKLGRP